jgi:hypothetical protein
MMKRIFCSLSAIFFTAGALAGPTLGKNGVTLSKDSAYVRMAAKSDFWRLIPWYQAQSGEKTGAFAAIATGIAAFLADERLEEGKAQFSEAELVKLSPKLKKVAAKSFPLDDLATALDAGFEAAPGGPFHATVERFEGKADMKRLEKVLSKNDRSADDFIVASFAVGVLLGDRAKAATSQYALVGAFDAKKKRVLILDPDRKSYGPYWAPLDKFLDAMNTTDPATSKKRGLLVIAKGPAPSAEPAAAE